MPGSESQLDHGAAIPAYGALATRLTEAVRRARAALAAHTEHLPIDTVAQLDGLLADFARRRVRIALYGEVKAGKSTLLNAIAGAALSPVAFEPLTSIPVWVTYGARTAWRVGDRRLGHVGDIERVMRDGAGDVPAVVVETPLDLLQLGGQLDLLDTPGVGGAARFDAITAGETRSLDAVVLVVRYPALFTQLTRRLMDGLQADIGKLCVVWNLDAACADLAPEDRARHAETLRATVAGAHDLFLVDARAGFHAAQRHDDAARAASGLDAFTAALARFASSGGRAVAALREAAKRAHLRLAAAHDTLQERHTVLADALADARRRLQAVAAAAEAEAAAERARLAAFDAAVARIGQHAVATSTRLGADLRQRLRTARRRWVRSGDYAALHAAVAAAVRRYAGEVEAASRTTSDAVQGEVATFGTAAAGAPRARTELALGLLAPEERARRATAGRWQRLRRALWHRWYLPGLLALDAEIAAEAAAQAAWFESVATPARAAAENTLAARLAEIRGRADTELHRITAESNFVANEAEFVQLGQDLPIAGAQLAAVAQIGAEARALVAAAVESNDP